MNILVTGGASGLGASIVKRLAGEDTNNTLYFTYSSSAAAAKEIEGAYKNTKAIACNFSVAPSLEELLAQLPALDIDVLVNNAYGAIHKEHFYKTDHHVFLDSFQQNVIPTLRITAEAMKVFRKKKFGKIINIISSAVVNKPPAGWAEYVANKAYLLAMSKSWASEGIKFNISSNCISPAFMLTNMTSDTDDRVIEQMQQEHPLKKLLTTDEVADAVAFFVKASQQMNGTHLVINAGASFV
jgi:3-oxoacyl-[acyl-carrier protein] reductase